MRYLWKIGGEAGFGIMTTGLFFSKIASRLGYHIFDYVAYPSLIRGGHNTYDVIFSDEEVHSLQKAIDCLVCLNKDTFEFHKDRLGKNSLVLYDEEDFVPVGDFRMVKVPFRKILKENAAQAVMKNTIALGSSLAILGSDLTILNEMIEKQFGRKGTEVVDFNKKFASSGYDHIVANYKDLVSNVLLKKETKQKVVMTGNDAFSLGAVIADCRFYSAYPMTPSSSVLTSLAAWQEKSGMIVRHAEDEISVINTALGASFAGVRASVGTSGGGFALMVETISLAGITEIPIVIFLSQRPGPATGMPTWTEQGDLLFATFSGHGEFPKIVLAAGDISEMLELTTEAFNLADIYQTPVIVMSDMFLSESHKSLSQDFVDNLTANYKVEKGKTITNFAEGNSKYLRYKVEEDGISNRLIPGLKGQFYQANSYEHLEDGHTTESGVERLKQADKRNRKGLTYLKNHFEAPKTFGDINSAETVFVSWGSNKGPILEAMKLLDQAGNKTAMIHFTHMYPLDKEKILSYFSDKKRYVLVENNSHAQFGKLLLMETGVELKEKLLKYDGRPFWPEEIADYIKSK